MNKRNKALVIAVATALGAFASSAALADTKTITINASVSAVCHFSNNSTQVITIGPIDPSGAGDVTGNVDVLYKCTKGDTPSVLSGPSSDTLACTGGGCTVGTDTLAVYSITYSAPVQGSGFGSGQDKTLTVTGKVQQSDYQNAVVGNYSHNITVTLTP
jgi:spore coat protein U-like protein